MEYQFKGRNIINFKDVRCGQLFKYQLHPEVYMRVSDHNRAIFIINDRNVDAIDIKTGILYSVEPNEKVILLNINVEITET